MPSGTLYLHSLSSLLKIFFKISIHSTMRSSLMSILLVKCFYWCKDILKTKNRVKLEVMMVLIKIRTSNMDKRPTILQLKPSYSGQRDYADIKNLHFLRFMKNLKK